MFSAWATRLGRFTTDAVARFRPHLLRPTGCNALGRWRSSPDARWVPAVCSWCVQPRQSTRQAEQTQTVDDRIREPERRVESVRVHQDWWISSNFQVRTRLILRITTRSNLIIESLKIFQIVYLSFHNPTEPWSSSQSTRWGNGMTSIATSFHRQSRRAVHKWTNGAKSWEPTNASLLPFVRCPDSALLLHLIRYLILMYFKHCKHCKWESQLKHMHDLI